MNKILSNLFTLAAAAFFILNASGCSTTSEIQNTKNETEIHNWIDLDTIKAGKFDTGKMWTFEYPPVDYFAQEYGFRPTEEWLKKVRMSALRFATYCSASFVSADGLVMTNNHCGRESISEVQKEGEDLHANGFFAQTLEEERQVPGLFVDQLVLLKDVTEEIQSAVDKVPDQEKNKVEKITIKDLEKRETEANPGLEIKITSLYNGGKYSLYGYKRYTDVRLVFSPETQLGFFGGDPDNFTYPRYNLDCTFFRVYDENGIPLKTENYFKWSPNGAVEGDAVFVVGNPGNTDRLSTVAELEYARDIQYPRTLEMLNGLIEVYSNLINENPDRVDQLQNTLYNFTNSHKAYTGMLEGLRDPVLMQKKRDFENNFRSAVERKSDLNEKYGMLWDKIKEGKDKLRTLSNKLYAMNQNPLSSAEYFLIALNMLDLADQLRLPEDQREEEYKGEMVDSTIISLYPEDLNEKMQRSLLEKQLDRITKYLGADDPLVIDLTEGKTGADAVNSVLQRSSLTSREKIMQLAAKGSDAILNSDDPFIKYVLNAESRRAELQSQVSEITSQEKVYSASLGRALFEVYGTSIPPDATFTLRLADGIVTGFPYNGTVAPPVTTFYGMYDRYYSFNKEFPWSLPKRWVDPPAEFDLATPYNFISTNDIIGGNSGSPVINKNAEVVGLAFDGNIQSLPGNFIFTTEENRCVSVHSAGMFEAIQDLYKAARLSEELKNGKIIEGHASN